MKVAEGLLPGVLKGIAEHLRLTEPKLPHDAAAIEQAADRIAALEAELAKVREELAECQMLESIGVGMHGETLASLAVMKAERDAAMADAERWRNIRCLDADSVMRMVIDEGRFFKATDRDAYIDKRAARKEPVSQNLETQLQVAAVIAARKEGQ